MGTVSVGQQEGVFRSSFRAMGTDISLVAPRGAPGFERVAADVHDLFDRLERRFSRFRADSELSAVNRRAGRWTAVSETFAELLGIALDGARRSGGLFDPTVLPALLAAGYDRDFRDLPADGDGPPVTRRGPPGRWPDVLVRDGRVFVPDGVALDFGGIAKGWAADLASELTRELPWAVVDAGGDLRITGRPPDGGLEVVVDDPEVLGAGLLLLRLDGGALATSSVTLRSWSRGGERAHHIIDPRTGIPARSTVLQATAWAPDCVEAEIRAKWALLAGPPVMRELPVVLFLDDSRVLVGLERDATSCPSSD
jgi:thiamine biosynthesis lipoprotein